MALTISVPRGDTLTWSFDINSDITGWTPKFSVKRASGFADAADGAAVLTILNGAGLTVSNAALGIVTLVVPASQMAALTPGTYVWDLQLTSGAVVRTVRVDGSPIGYLVIEPDVTRT
jgi:hypothetical protein